MNIEGGFYMLEILFDDSAAGALQLALAGQESILGGSIEILTSEPISDTERRTLIQQAEERERRGWADAVPLEGNRADILPLPLMLSVGAIDEDSIGPLRERTLQTLMAVHPAIGEEAACSLLATARVSLARLLAGVERGESLRIWIDRTPDNRCALGWLLNQLEQAGHPSPDITLVPLPDFESHPDGAALQARGWAEVEPYRWGRLAQTARPLPSPLCRTWAAEWRTLRRENAPLRAVVNGALVSVSESFYDPFILRALAGQPSEFSEARLIGQLLGGLPGVSDALIALRIERMVETGQLEPVTQPAPGDPAYHRTLRKVCRAKTTP